MHADKAHTPLLHTESGRIESPETVRNEGCDLKVQGSRFELRERLGGGGVENRKCGVNSQSRRRAQRLRVTGEGACTFNVRALSRDCKVLCVSSALGSEAQELFVCNLQAQPKVVDEVVLRGVISARWIVFVLSSLLKGDRQSLAEALACFVASGVTVGEVVVSLGRPSPAVNARDPAVPGAIWSWSSRP